MYQCDGPERVRSDSSLKYAIISMILDEDKPQRVFITKLES